MCALQQRDQGRPDGGQALALWVSIKAAIRQQAQKAGLRRGSGPPSEPRCNTERARLLVTKGGGGNVSLDEWQGRGSSRSACPMRPLPLRCCRCALAAGLCRHRNAARSFGSHLPR